jgi:hypothetical protein
MSKLTLVVNGPDHKLKFINNLSPRDCFSHGTEYFILLKLNRGLSGSAETATCINIQSLQLKEFGKFEQVVPIKMDLVCTISEE